MQTYKTNGFSLPFPWQQIITWLFYILNIALFYTFTITLFSSFQKIIISITFAIFSLIVLILSFISTYIDPSDELFMAEMKKKEEAKREKRNYWLEISKNQSFCIICCSNINASSKHCKKCNKCINYFDHHCNWLNNCIGKANYAYFYCLLLVSILQLFFVAGISVYGFINYIQYTDDSNKDNYALESAIIAIILSVCDLILGINLTYLWIIHTWLRYKGITTYEYILMKIEEREAKEKRENKSEDDPLRNMNNSNINGHGIMQQNNFFNQTDLKAVEEKKKNKNKFTPNELIKVLDAIPKDKEYLKDKEETIIIQDPNAKENIFKPIVDKIYLNKQTSDCQNSIKNVKTSLD